MAPSSAVAKNRLGRKAGRGFMLARFGMTHLLVDGSKSTMRSPALDHQALPR
jgi:hypothetical protein